MVSRLKFGKLIDEECLHVSTNFHFKKFKNVKVMKISMCVIQKMSYSITFSWTLHHRSISFKFVLVLKRTDFYGHIIIPL